MLPIITVRINTIGRIQLNGCWGWAEYQTRLALESHEYGPENLSALVLM